ncbi:MAG: hypothetical protein IPP82_15820 [Xanthomonadales bacterium]|nr:hypothetical protein [Xanthomonadales bacterium]
MSNPLDVGQWAKNWEAMARQAQAAISGVPGQAAWGGAATPASAWAANSAQANPFSGGKQQGEAIEHLLAGAQGYLGMLQSLAAAAGGQATPAFAMPFSAGGFAGAFPPSAMNNPFAAAMRGFGTQGASGFEQMMEQFAAVAGPMFDKAKGALQMPAFGPFREKQENRQHAAQVFIDYQEQSARYDRLMLKVSEKAFACFQLKLAEREEPGRQIDSVRGLYDVWIDAAEEAYAEIALSEEFREVYAAVVDAQMRVRQQVQGEIEKFCNQLGMPTRSEVNSIGERLQALRREFRAQSEGADDAETLQAQMAELRRELSALKSTGSRPSKAVPKTKASKSETVRKAATVSTAASAERIEKTGEPARGQISPEEKSSTRKPRRKVAAKATTARREKRRKSSSVKTVKATVAVPKSAKARDGASGKSGSFAASIARFARKSKTATTVAPGKRAKAKTAKRGGSK